MPFVKLHAWSTSLLFNKFKIHNMAQSTNLSDFKTEASINSVSYILPPPSPLEYSSPNLAKAWRRWKNGYDTFYRLRNGDQIPEDKRMFLLLQALGSEAVSIYYDMDFDKEEDKMSHDAVLSRFAEKCAPRQHVLVERHNFYQIARNTRESTCDFVDRLSGPPEIASFMIKPLTWFETSSF